VAGTQVLFSVWDTRVQDFEMFVKSTGYDATRGVYSIAKNGWEQRGATWKEFDLEKREWTIAGQRMKMKRPHLIPLSVQAVEVLRKVEALNPKHKSDDFLFPHTKDATKTMSAGTINAVFK